MAQKTLRPAQVAAEKKRQTYKRKLQMIKDKEKSASKLSAKDQKEALKKARFDAKKKRKKKNKNKSKKKK